MKIRWGIIGLGKIAHTFVADLKHVKDAELFAVASRTQSKANDFAEKHKATHAYGSYTQLLENPDVDVVYIATPHVFHYENTMEAIQHQKAVLCEKPLAMNSGQVREMQNYAKKQSVFFMEALWTNFMPSIKFLNTLNKKQTYGEITKLKAEFCFRPKFDKNGRLFNKSLGGGALLDIGIYPVFLALKMLGLPDRIEANSKFNETNVDVETKILFKYEDDVTAELFCSLNKSTKSEAHIFYEDAEVIMHERFHESDKLSIKTNNEEVLKDFKHQYQGYNFEIEHVNKCLKEGIIESPIMSHAFSLQLIQTLDKIREIVGLKY